MSLLKPTLELILILIIVSVFRSHNVRIEESMAMFRLVVVSCAGAHVVCIVYGSRERDRTGAPSIHVTKGI